MMITNAEISFDLVMEDDMSFVEGSYRLPGRDWEVFVFSRYDGIKSEVETAVKLGGATGVVVRLPRNEKLNKSIVRHTLSESLGVVDWREIPGPDSMHLR